MKFVIEMVDSVNVKQTIKEEPVKSATMVSTIIPTATVSIRRFSMFYHLSLLNSGIAEHNAQGCAFARPKFRPQLQIAHPMLISFRHH